MGGISNQGLFRSIFYDATFFGSEEVFVNIYLLYFYVTQPSRNQIAYLVRNIY